MTTTEGVWHAHADDQLQYGRNAHMSATGKWEITMNTPMGAQPATLELEENDSTLTGTMTAAAAPGPLEVTDGTVDGDNLTWKAALTQPMPINLEFSATVDGDKISGTAKLGAFGDASFEGARA
jgi:hypothetical protein